MNEDTPEQTAIDRAIRSCELVGEPPTQIAFDTEEAYEEFKSMAIQSARVAGELPKPWGHELWSYLHQNHGLTLLQSELDDIVREASKLLDSDLQRQLAEARKQIEDLTDSRNLWCNKSDDWYSQLCEAIIQRDYWIEHCGHINKKEQEQWQARIKAERSLANAYAALIAIAAASALTLASIAWIAWR